MSCRSRLAARSLRGSPAQAPRSEATKHPGNMAVRGRAPKVQSRTASNISASTGYSISKRQQTGHTRRARNGGGVGGFPFAGVRRCGNGGQAHLRKLLAHAIDDPNHPRQFCVKCTYVFLPLCPPKSARVLDRFQTKLLSRKKRWVAHLRTRVHVIIELHHHMGPVNTVQGRHKRLAGRAQAFKVRAEKIDQPCLQQAWFVTASKRPASGGAKRLTVPNVADHVARRAARAGGHAGEHSLRHTGHDSKDALDRSSGVMVDEHPCLIPFSSTIG